jgi:hypothetical protein
MHPLCLSLSWQDCGALLTAPEVGGFQPGSTPWAAKGRDGWQTKEPCGPALLGSI